MTEGGRELRQADSFAVGFVGVPGQRTFYMQLVDGGEEYAYLLEKSQVIGFAEYATRLLAAIGEVGAGGAVTPPVVVEPTEVRFRVGGMQLDYNNDLELASLTLVPTTDDDVAIVHHVSPSQLEAAAEAGAKSVLEGRPRCPDCSLAMDPEGHVCPTTNGDLRHHRS